jgi:hypothetical protein
LIGGENEKNTFPFDGNGLRIDLIKTKQKQTMKERRRKERKRRKWTCVTRENGLMKAVAYSTCGGAVNTNSGRNNSNQLCFI